MDERAIDLLEKILDRLDDISEGIGEINMKVAPSSAVHKALESLQAALNELPAEIDAAVNPRGVRHGR